MSASALLVCDMITAYDFQDAEIVAAHAPGPVQRIAELVERARTDDTRVVYVNDNYGNWDGSRDGLIRRALEGAHPELVEPIKPEREFAFVWKPRHSAFYETSLNYLLREQGVERVVITGQVTEQCVLYTALDAYIRHFEIVVPSDAVVALHPHLAEASLEMMRRNMRAETPATSAVHLTGTTRNRSTSVIELKRRSLAASPAARPPAAAPPGSKAPTSASSTRRSARTPPAAARPPRLQAAHMREERASDSSTLVAMPWTAMKRGPLW